MTTISESMGELSLTITRDHIHEIEKMAVYFPLRKTHPLTFDGPYLGVDPVVFTPSDYNALFDVFHIHIKDVEFAIRKTSSIDRNFKVISDPYNLLIVWLCHLAPIYIKDKRVCREFQKNLLLLFLFRIFTGVVNNSFRHGTNKGIVEATIASLSRKSDIIRYESWKKLIESHVDKILDPQGRFYQTIVDGAPDDMFLRVISESQTALRAKIVTFANAYYETYASGDEMKFASSISENSEGEKIIAQTASVIDSATSAMVSEILNPNMFVNDLAVHDISQLFTTISPKMLKTALLRINEVAVLQTSSRTFDKVKTDKEGTIFIGVRALVIEIIRTTVRVCRLKKINMGNKARVFETMKDAVTSSRNLDTDVRDIKRSISHLVDPFNITINTASAASLRLSVVLYIVYRTILKMKT